MDNKDNISKKKKFSEKRKIDFGLEKRPNTRAFACALCTYLSFLDKQIFRMLEIRGLKWWILQ